MSTCTSKFSTPAREKRCGYLIFFQLLLLRITFLIGHMLCFFLFIFLQNDINGHRADPMISQNLHNRETR